ncbi:MFS transporter [Acidianus sp. HS-5]|uniref:MFS transporter n=1 Tax=Acidianus sp. HS-5 TaxID=2886040 RepID=UPI001F00C465|nr:MFS transporter [Acidianus sp. HS-5]BDC18499.1 MFS transporter [Acidianus sp. HS-5]
MLTMEVNIKYILLSRIFRSLPLGYMSFLVPLYLHKIGIPTFLIGIYFLIATISMAVLLIIAGFLGDAYGKRNILLLLSALFSLNLFIFAFVKIPLIVFLTSVLGVGTASGGGIGGGAGGGPFNPLQTALIADHSMQEERTKLYSLNFAVATISAFVGGLISDLVTTIYPSISYSFLFTLGFIISIFSILFVYLIQKDKGTGKLSAPKASFSSISKISIAGSLGSIGLGMVMPLIPLWFKLDFNASESEISYLYSVSYGLVGISFLFADKIEKLLGRVKSISMLRGLSSILLILIPFSPTFIIASAIFLIRGITYTVTIPMRQSLAMDVFSDRERASGTSITGLARRVPYGLGSLISGALFSAGLFAVSIFLGGFISLFDPLLYYMFFRNYEKRSKE